MTLRFIHILHSHPSYVGKAGIVQGLLLSRSKPLAINSSIYLCIRLLVVDMAFYKQVDLADLPLVLINSMLNASHWWQNLW